MTVLADFRADYTAVTEGVGLLDRSERCKLALSGADAKEFLHGQVTQDISGLSPGHGAYAAFLTPKGKMLGDLRVLDAGDELLLDTERVALQPLFSMIRRYSLGHAVELHKRTLECGLLSLLGPRSDAILAEAGASGMPGLTEHDHVAGRIATVRVRVIRTDLGLDLLYAAGDSEPIRDALLAAGAVVVGLEAAECLRVERGRPRYGVDLDETVIPQEAGLNERAVSFTKGCYVGQETVARLFYKGNPTRQLRGVTSAEPLAVGTELTIEGRTVGVITSAAQSPSLGPIALALVRREAPPGAVVATDRHEGLVVELPFS